MALALEHRKVLVLNKGWTPINVVSLKRALKLLFSWHSDEIVDGNIVREAEPKARILDPFDNYSLYTWHDWASIMPKDGDNTLNNEFKTPEIIILSRYNKLPSHRVNFNRKTIYKRDQYTCQYCGEKLSTEDVTLDHIVPKSQNGGTNWNNICCCCIQCNSQKRDRRPEEAFKDRKNWKGPSPMKLINGMPKEPKYSLFKDDKAMVCKSWQDFISETYWNVTLQNDMSK